MLQGGQVGLVRRINNLFSGRSQHPTHKVDASGPYAFGIDVTGAIGEMVAAKALGVYFCNAAFQTVDVGGKYEVKTTGTKSGHLLIQEAYPDTSVYILVTGDGPEFDVAGWISGAAAKQKQWWKEGRAGVFSYWVPQSALAPISELSEVAP